MEERPESEADGELELTPEDLVAADEAMLLDLGGAEHLADLIADQSLGERPPDTPGSAAGSEDATPAADDDDQTPSTS